MNLPFTHHDKTLSRNPFRKWYVSVHYLLILGLCLIALAPQIVFAAGIFASSPTSPGGTFNVGGSTIGFPTSASLVIFNNSLTETLNVGFTSITGANASNFSLTAPAAFPVNIAANSFILLTIQCVPSGVGLHVAQLNLTSSDSAQPTPTYTLNCAGQSPVYNSNPAPSSAFNVGATGVGIPITRSIVVSNTGTGALVVSGYSLSGANTGDFLVPSPAFPFTVNPSGQQNVQVRCTPSALGARTATLSLSSNDPANPTPTYNLSCTASDVNLAISKTDSADPALAGSALTYTINLTNSGASTATNVVVNDALPAGVTVSSFSAGCSGTTTITCNIANLGPAANAVITIATTVNGLATSPITNVVSVNSAEFDTNLANNIYTETTTITAQANLGISKSDGQTTASPGTLITYTIVVTNAGPSPVNNAPVNDTLLPALTNASWACAASAGSSCVANGSGSINTNVNLAVGGAVTFTLSATIDANATGLLTNTASVTVPAGVVDPVALNNSATDVNTLVASADLRISKTDGATTAVPGTAITYTLIVSNAGPSAVTGAPVTDVLPAALLNATWTCNAVGGSCPASGVGDINVSVNLSVGGIATFNIFATIAPTATGLLTNTAGITVPLNVTDPNNANNSAQDVDTLTPRADLSISKTDDQTQVTPGATVIYTVMVNNAGPSAALGATVNDILPVSLSGVTWTCAAQTGMSCPANGSGNLAVNVNFTTTGTVTFTISGNLDVNATGGLTNMATVSAPIGVTDPNVANNSATDFDQMPTDLGVTKTHAPTTVVPGSPITYTIVVTNAGPTRVIGAGVTDLLPTGLSNIAWTCAATSGSACNTTSGSGNLNTSVDLAVNGIVTFTITATVQSTASGTLNNTANVVAPFGIVDTAPSNNASTDSTLLDPQTELGISKSDGVNTVIAGAPLIYTIIVTNAGPSAAVNATVLDTLPSVLGNAAWTCTASTGSSCSNGIGNINASVTILPGGRLTFTLSTVVDSFAGIGTLTNTARINAAPSATDPIAANNIFTDTDAIDVQTDLIVTASHTPNPAPSGGLITFTLTVTNNGPSAATSVQLTDTLPVNVALVTPSPLCSGTTLLTCNIGLLTPGGSAQVVFTGITSPTLVGFITNTMSVSGAQFDPNLANNSYTQTILVVQDANLQLTKLDAPDPVNAGSTLLYTLIITNLGPSGASNVVLTDVLPLSAAFASASAGCNGTTTITCTVASISANASAVVTIAATVNPFTRGLITNTASVSAFEPDAIQSNNVSTQTTTVNGSANLAISKLGPTGILTANHPITYSIVITNNGPSAAQNVIFTDTLPIAVSYQNIIPANGWTCNTPSVGITGTVVCSTPTLTNGVVTTITLVAKAPFATSVFTNFVNITSATADPNASDNLASHATSTRLLTTYLPLIIKSLPPQPDLVGSFTLSPSGPNYVAGQPVTITIKVTNQGTIDAAPFYVDFYINPSVTPTVNVPWNNTCSLNPCFGLAWYVSGGLPAGQSITLSSLSSGYDARYSTWPGWFAVGTTDLYLLVDSWNPTVSTGAVLENNESNNLSQRRGLIVTGVNPPFPRTSQEVQPRR